MDDSLQSKKKLRLIDLVDAHNSRDDHATAHRLLVDFRAEDTGDPRLLWRLSRTLYELAVASSASAPTSAPNALDLTSPSTIDSKETLLAALRLADLAVDAATTASKNNSKDGGPGGAEAHLWYAIILEALGKWKPLRERIDDAFVVKDHYLKSLQLKPQSATVLHCLGSWCFTVASVNWFERKLAQVASRDLPTSTFEEALGYFRAAEEISPNFYSVNLLFIAKCYLQLKNQVKANEYLERVVSFAPLRTDEDNNAVKEAQRLLYLED